MISLSNNAWNDDETSMFEDEVYWAILGPFIDEAPASLSR